MHKYLRAIGFSKLSRRRELEALIGKTVKDAGTRNFTTYNNETLLAEYSYEFGPDMGVTVCGELDENDHFLFDYIYPFFKGKLISSEEKVTIERHAEKISYAGICDDSRVGITIIFYLLNRIPYIMKRNTNSLPSFGTTLSLSGLSIDGTIMMPIEKTPKEVKKNNEHSKVRTRLVEKARQGDEGAIESLTLSDMDMYSSISRKIKDNDIFTIVDTYFMPYGVECDQYSVLGEITDCRLINNSVTGESIYQMDLIANEIALSICINKEDLFGEPEVGRRFKGTVWLQGFINY